MPVVLQRKCVDSSQCNELTICGSSEHSALLNYIRRNLLGLLVCSVLVSTLPLPAAQFYLGNARDASFLMIFVHSKTGARPNFEGNQKSISKNQWIDGCVFTLYNRKQRPYLREQLENDKCYRHFILFLT